MWKQEIYINWKDIRIPEKLRGLLDYMMVNNKLEALDDFDRKLLHIMSDDVLSKINANVTAWEDDVPEQVAKAIKFMRLFGYVPKEELVASKGK